MKILVLEDDPVTLKLERSILEKAGYQVVQARSVTEAIRMADSTPDIHVVLSDVVMPGLSGLEFVRHLRTRPGNNRPPVILCTSLNDEQSVIEGVQLGVRDYIVKPIQPEVLLKKIEKVIDETPGSILIVDDEEMLLTLLRRIVEREGYQVITAATAEEGLSKIAVNKVAVVISDIQLVGMSGLDLLKSVKDTHPKLPVLLMTGHTGRYGKDKVMAAGADGYIEKPFNNLELMRKVESFFRQQKEKKS